MKAILFGAGNIGRQALEQLGSDRVTFFIDNHPTGKEIEGIPVYKYEYGLSKRGDSPIVITVSKRYTDELSEQLAKSGVNEVYLLQDYLAKITREKITNRTDYIALYNRAIGWIEKNTVSGKGIICNTGLPKPYPEVSGYYIPTLINWGYRDLAVQYAKWLCSIQKDDGSWWDTDDRMPYVFDTGQILKGLLAVRDIYPEADPHIIKGCDWLIGNIESDGRFHQAEGRDWDDNSGFSSELIHLYCLSPLLKAAEIFDREQYKIKALMAKNYYLTGYRDKILDFHLLSHFYAYVMEALLDLGEIELASEAMDNIAKIQKEDGSVPGLNNVNWVCSTGLFQLAIVWYQLGEIERGDRAFAYACKLQNEPGGWYGGYVHQDHPEEAPTYFPTQEISWASKYFLDALMWKNRVMFDEQAPTFQLKYRADDGRIRCIADQISILEQKLNKPIRICDAGCGKGAYIRILKKEHPDNLYYGVDISKCVMTYLDEGLAETCIGSLTCLPFSDDELDIVYACESLEHAVDIDSAVREMSRVTKSGGCIVVIDKDKAALGRMEIEDWEQWFDVELLRTIMDKYCSKVIIQRNVPYEDRADNLFCAWIGVIR